MKKIFLISCFILAACNETNTVEIPVEDPVTASKIAYASAFATIQLLDGFRSFNPNMDGDGEWEWESQCENSGTAKIKSEGYTYNGERLFRISCNNCLANIPCLSDTEEQIYMNGNVYFTYSDINGLNAIYTWTSGTMTFGGYASGTCSFNKTLRLYIEFPSSDSPPSVMDFSGFVCDSIDAEEVNSLAGEIYTCN